MPSIRESDIFDVIRAIESGAIIARRGDVLHQDEGEEDIEFRTEAGWRFVVAMEAGEWGGIVDIDTPAGERLSLGDAPFTHDLMPALCEYRPDGDALVRWLTGAAPPEPRR